MDRRRPLVPERLATTGTPPVCGAPERIDREGHTPRILSTALDPELITEALCRFLMDPASFHHEPPTLYGLARRPAVDGAGSMSWRRPIPVLP